MPPKVTPRESAEQASRMLRAALHYAERGFKVLPVRRENKHPYTSRGVHDATTNMATIRSWWRQWPDANVAIALAGLVVADFDPRHGGDLDTLLAFPGEWPSGAARARTGGGGWHYIFRAREGATYPGKLGAGVDLKRGEGAYIIVAPSVHANGVRYAWRRAPWDTKLPQAPDWFEHPSKPEQQPDDATDGAPIPEGERNNHLISLAGSMRRRGMGADAIEAALLIENSQRCTPPLDEAEVQRIAASGASYAPDTRIARLEDFWAYMPAHKYLYVPTRDLWPPASVDGRVEWPMVGDKSMPPSLFLDRRRAIEQLIWAPGEPQMVEGRVLDQGGWVYHKGIRAFNLYRPPPAISGDPEKATRWREHGQRLYPEEWDHIERWLAYKVQHPGAKINHAIVLGGAQGIGKDTLLEPVRFALGPWNWSEISPLQMLGRFNGWAKAVIVRVSEARDLGEIDRFSFYDHSKSYIAAPPDSLRVDEKNIREHYILNVLGLVITSNHRTDCLYIPSDDRRHFVAWSDTKKEEFEPAFWSDFWRWYLYGNGLADVAAHLLALDLSGFDPKAPPRRTRAFEAIVQAGIPQEDSDLATVIEAMGSPEAFTIADLKRVASQQNMHDVVALLGEQRARARIPHMLDRVGYVSVPNPDAPKNGGRWKVGDRYVPVYAATVLTPREQNAAVRKRVRRSRAKP